MESLRLQNVQNPVIPIVGDLVRRCPGAISLGQGVVHYGPPAQSAEQIARFFADPDNHKYRPVEGIPELREAILRKLARENRLEVQDPSCLLVTAGGNMAFMNAIIAIADPGDEVVIQAPYYFNHEMAITIAGCKPVIVQTDSSYQLSPEAVAAAITDRTRAVVTISPNNPTGAVYTEDSLREVNALCERRGLYHVHDEAYEYFTYGDARHFSPGSAPGSAAHTISFFSLSKSYGFASWRIGYMVVPTALVLAVKKIQDTILICPPVVSQFAALGALEAGREYCEQHLPGLREVRASALDHFAEIADICRVPAADGAFYFLLQLATGRPAMEIVTRLIEEHAVGVLPGDTFGIADTRCLRVSYGALRTDTAREGIGRLVTGLKALLTP